eukprot:Lithocolla_globosa_v1_NODE_1848_length_2298_cov_11.398128.p4 type:complete len:135 gc:universal NODE_1848_length_2298_cov_11.398128:1094-1498(+)
MDSKTKLLEPSAWNKSLTATIDSTSANCPATAVILDPSIPEIRERIVSRASSQGTARKDEPSRIMGEPRRWTLSPSVAARDLSASHSSFTSSCSRGSTRITSSPLQSTRMFEPSASCTSMDSVWRSSQGRAVKA